MVRPCSTCWMSAFGACRGGKGSNRNQGYQANHSEFLHKASMHCVMQYQGIGMLRCYLNQKARHWAGLPKTDIVTPISVLKLLKECWQVLNSRCIPFLKVV